MACTIEPIQSDLCPGEWNITCLKIGSSIQISWSIIDTTGKPIAIGNNDTFQTVIQNAGGTTIQTMLLGSGHSVSGTNIINFLFSAPLTNAAGTYTYTTIWTRPDTSEIIPIFEGTITVEA